MQDNRFDYNSKDSQATRIEPVEPGRFDFAAYQDYEAEKLEKCQAFRRSDSRVLVYRRFRVADVFSDGCKDMESSLRLQLGALKRSMEFEADVPNFLEPWFGIGVAASAFGSQYAWEPGQAPAVRPRFGSVSDALSHPYVPIRETGIGKHILRMIDYFLEETGGRLPMSLTDVQSPLNAACSIVDINRFFMELYDEPEQAEEFLMLLSGLIAEFAGEQKRRIGSALAGPGHGFASCKVFTGLGMSDDNAAMLSPVLYSKHIASSLEKCAEAFGGPAFHSCGDWSALLGVIRSIRGMKVVDGAFSPMTDPQPNEPEKFRDAFCDTGIVVNMRVVGSPAVVEEKVRGMWKPGMKLIVVTYCKTPEEQAEACRRIHAVCR